MALNEVFSAVEKMNAAYDSYEKTSEAKKLQDEQNKLDAVVHAALQKGVTRSDMDKKLKPGLFKKDSHGYNRITRIEEERRHSSTDISKDSKIGALFSKYNQKNKSELEVELKDQVEAFDKQKEKTEKTEFTVLSGSEKGKKITHGDISKYEKTAHDKIDDLVRRQKDTKAAQQKIGQMLGHLWKQGASNDTFKKVADRFHATAHKEGKKIAYPNVPQQKAALVESPKAEEKKTVVVEQKATPVVEAAKVEVKKAAEIVEQKATDINAKIAHAIANAKAEVKNAVEVVEQKVKEKTDAEVVKASA